MRAFIVPKGCTAIDQLCLIERPDPTPGPGQVLLRVRAASLNYRDQAVVTGNYFGGVATRDLIPLSDGAGEVLAIGAGVSRFKVGDRVTAGFSQRDPVGPPLGERRALGSPLDGVLAEKIVLYEDGLVAIPDGYTDEEASCLPCAGVTAWNALMVAGKPLRPGQTVLVLGTGGVSMLALQFAKAAGARVIATSSTDEKLARVKALGASDGINYRTTPDWEKEVLRLTGGRGVDCVVEVGGTGTINRSFQSVAAGGKVSLIGVLSSGDTNPYLIMLKTASLHGIAVGDLQSFADMVAAINVNRIRPVIDKVFAFEDAVAAYRHHVSGNFIGKVVIRI